VGDKEYLSRGDIVYKEIQVIANLFMVFFFLLREAILFNVKVFKLKGLPIEIY